MSISSLYEPLDVDSYEIRLLSIHPGEPGSKIQCELKKVDLFRVHDFSALSYCWGDENSTRDIIVNGILVPVTVNLADALNRLRELNVVRIWADAVCINQSDKTERSSQVRIMKEVYSKAAVTYAWLEQASDRHIVPMKFLNDVHEVSKKPFPNFQMKIARIRSARRFRMEPSRHSTTSRFPRMLSTEDEFQRLMRYFELEFWKRRWIIQEITAATTVRFLYQGETLPMLELEHALEICRNSRYWQPSHDEVCRYFQRVSDIRKAYHAGNTFGICRAIFETQDSRSKDPRDKIFALIGICGDGPGLIPLPNYSQDPEDIARDFTRELLRKNVCFEIILMAPRPVLPSSRLPSWSPDWLSSNLPEDACTIPYQAPLFHHQYALDSLDTEPGSLKVQGIFLATIVALTSVIGSTTPTPITIQQSGSLTGDPPQHQNRYYGRTASRVGDALIGCLLYTSLGPRCMYIRFEFTNIFYRHLKCSLFTHTTHMVQSEQQSNTDSFAAWLRANHQFAINGQRLEDFFKSHLLHTRGWILLNRIILCPILLLCPGVIAFGVYYTRKPYGRLKSMGLIALFVGAFTSLFWLAIFGSALFNITWGHSICRKAVRSALQQDRRLAMTDRGMLAMVCPNSEVGDRICFIAGCSGAVILRPSLSPDETYYVVGKAFAHLSRKEASMYAAFGHKRYVPSKFPEKDEKNRKIFAMLMEKCRQAPWWREFVLV